VPGAKLNGLGPAKTPSPVRGLDMLAQDASPIRANLRRESGFSLLLNPGCPKGNSVSSRR
jgi:hypothetical protein